MPSDEAYIVPTWTVSGLPSGVTAGSLTGDSLTISGGVADSVETYNVIVGVTQGNYSDSKVYSMQVTDKGYITINDYGNITNFYLNRETTYTFTFSSLMPSTQSDSTPSWSISGVPSGLSVQDKSYWLTIGGSVASTGTWNVTISVSMGSHSDSKVFNLVLADNGNLIISTTSLASGYAGYSYSQTVDVTTSGNLPSYYGSYASLTASALPSGISLSGHTLRGTPTAAGTTNITFNATYDGYYAPAKTLSLVINAPKPMWKVSTITVYITYAYYGVTTKTHNISYS